MGKRQNETSLVVRWIRIRLPIQGTWVRSPVQEDSTCLREPHVPHLVSPRAYSPCKRSHCSETPAHRNEEESPGSAARTPERSSEDSAAKKKERKFLKKIE